MNNILKIGVIGTGNHTRENLIPALKSVKGVGVQTIQSRNKDNAEMASFEFDIPQARSSTDKNLILDPMHDAVIVSTTPENHQELLLLAIKHGRNIFVEKPPAVNLESMLSIKSAIDATDHSLAIQFGFNFRHSDFYQLISDSVAKKKHSISYMKIKSYSSKPTSPMWQYDDVLSSSLYAVHIHAIEMLCYTLGTLLDVEYKITWLNKSKYVMTIVASFAEGKTGVLELSNASNRFEFDVECIDSNENIYRCSGFNRLEVCGPDYDTEEVFQSKSYIKYDIPFLRGGFNRTGYSKQFDFFRDSIINKTTDIKSIESCTDTYKLIDRIISHD